MSCTFVTFTGGCPHHAKSSFVREMCQSANRAPKGWKRARQLRFGEKLTQSYLVRMGTNSDVGSDTLKIGTIVDELKSDNEYVVVDGKDVESLIKEMQLSGDDALLAFEEEQERFLQLAEEKTGICSSAPETSTSTPGDSSVPEQVMEYFTDDNMLHMPKWAREAYEKGDHIELEKGSWNVIPAKGPRRLHAIVEAGNNGAFREGLSGSGDSGIFDYTVTDVASDYGIPVELVVDILIEFGVKTPVSLDASIQDKLMNKEIESMLHLITSFDAQDLSDRYSDRSLLELAEDYDMDVELIEELCEDEGIYLACDEHTRLQLSREDRVLDILLNDGARRKPYPSLLEGLVAPR